MCAAILCIFFFQAEDGIRDLVRSRGLGDVYKRQSQQREASVVPPRRRETGAPSRGRAAQQRDAERSPATSRTRGVSACECHGLSLIHI